MGDEANEGQVWGLQTRNWCRNMEDDGNWSPIGETLVETEENCDTWVVKSIHCD